MDSMKDSALPQLNSKAAKSYFTNFATILSHTINITALFSDCQVYVPRPSSLNSFTNSTLELIFDSVKFVRTTLRGSNIAMEESLSLFSLQRQRQLLPLSSQWTL